MQIGVARYNAIYGSFATLPLFLLWVYIGWLVFLAGAEVAFACQVWRSYSRKKQPISPQGKLSLACSILELVYRNFGKGRLHDADEIADSLDLRFDEISDILTSLTKNGLLHHVDDPENSGYVPAIPQENLALSQVVATVFGPRPDKEHQLAAEAYEALQKFTEEKNIRTLQME
jgi:membrane protein